MSANKPVTCDLRLGEVSHVATLPLGAAKWMTLPSLLNMLTSSMAWMGWTLSFFSDCWSFLSSPEDRTGPFFWVRRGVPLPLLDC